MDDKTQSVFIKVLERLMDMLDMSPDEAHDAIDTVEGKGGELNMAKEDPMRSEKDSMIAPDTTTLKSAQKEGEPNRPDVNFEGSDEEEKGESAQEEDDEENGKKRGFAKLMPFHKYE